ncbi:carbonic anhydrase [Vogesella oryzae]|uniref:carbonic anhydrase n=1 Tax=Vogesella oryzae TaxID=1735285 RepID=UPI0015825C69|nr:carbonic anhydrase [Vogesella oryzae]
MCQPSCHTDNAERQTLGRREFLRLGALGGGAVLLGSFLPRTALAAGGTDALLLSCMDYRLVDDTERFMAGMGMRNKYDHVVLAGAALGAITPKFPAWNTAFWEHLQVAIDLHHIHQVIILDHRDCGAYKVVLGQDFGQLPDVETKVHAETLMQLRQQILAKYPQLQVQTYLMALDGSVQQIVPRS